MHYDHEINYLIFRN